MSCPSRIGKSDHRFFQGLEDFAEIFPRLGKKRGKFSKAWKIRAERFQALEKFIARMAFIFPSVAQARPHQFGQELDRHRAFLQHRLMITAEVKFFALLALDLLTQPR